MTRFRLRTGPVALFGAIFVVALLVLLPLRLVLGWFDLERTKLAAREVTGSVWFGGVREAQVGGIALGDLAAHLSPWPLLVGRARIELDTPTDANRALHGAISASRHSVGLDDMTARLPTGDVFAPLPVSGLDLDAVSVRFDDGNCTKAEGRVKATLSGDIGGITLGQGLSGAARCDAGALLLPLASQAGTEQVALRLWNTGRFRADLTIKPTDPAAAQKLELSGFQPTPSGHRLSIDGRF
ncbi:type II secretion system protein N [Sphingomonas sp. RB3P16]|uniref:type II secretion system protein N n=1 Tax=Parasphingomonas frigoris TaxID=3096163 RepID=UPI002FCB7626